MILFDRIFDKNSPEFHISGRVRSQSQRHAIERSKLLSIWSTIAIREHDGIIKQIGGSIQPIPGGAIRDFLITVPSRYPYDGPKAFAVGWSPSGKHVYPNNEMCLWKMDQWTKDKTLAFAVAKTYVWIHKHEDWLRTGIWRGLEQPH